MNKILVVEDEKDIRENLELLLSSEGYEVVCAVDGIEALKIIKHSSLDLIISDIMMPNMNGIELFKKVREVESTKIIPFIFLTAKNDSFSIRTGMNLGADDYITKPFLADDILTAIKTRLEKYNSYNNQIGNIMDSISKYVPHELRTPLVAIIGYSDLIKSERNSFSENEITDMVHWINFAAKRLHNRIEKFIHFSDKNSLNNSEHELNYHDLGNNFIEEIITNNYLAIERKDDFKVDIESSKIGIPEHKIKLLLNELIENAVKFSEPGKNIIIKGINDNQNYSLEVTDYGIGINEEHLKILGAFKQIERESRQQVGNGLGLAIVNNILKPYDSDIKIESKENQFTTITLTLPKAING